MAHMEEFVNWLVLRLSAHELTHAIQQGTHVDEYRFALFREGAAMFLAENVLTREDTKMLLESRPASPRTRQRASACDQAFGSLEQLAAPSAMVVDQFRAAVEHVRSQPDFLITKLLDDGAFYAGDLRAHYAIAFVFLWYSPSACRQGAHRDLASRVGARCRQGGSCGSVGH